jgi:hypothetical protein
MRRRLGLVLVVVGLVVGVAIGFFSRLPLNSIWAPVIAALGASGLTAAAAIGLETTRDRRGALALQRQERREAYGRFLTASADYLMVAGELRQLKALSSGLAAKVHINDPVEFMQRFNERMAQPLTHAWAGVWLIGTPAAILAANRLVDATLPVNEMAVARGEGRHAALATLQGEKWTEQQQHAFRDAMKAVGLRRKEFAEVARKEMGGDVVDLFGGLPSEGGGPEE